MRRVLIVNVMVLAFFVGVVTGGGTAGGEVPARPSKSVRELQDAVSDLSMRMTVIEAQVGCSAVLNECLLAEGSLKEQVEELEFRLDHPELEN